MLFELISKLFLGIIALKNSSHTDMGATVANCGEGTSIFILNSVTLDPVNPSPGEKMALTIRYTVPANVIVIDGTVEYDITWNYIPFSPSVEPLCQDIPCPLSSGTYINTSYSHWPTGISGRIDSKMKWFDPGANLLLCVEISGTV